MGIQLYEDIIKITVPTPFPIGDVNTYIVKGDRLTMVDAGINTPEAKAIFEGGLNEAGYKLSDIEQVILTHHHPDHIGLLDLFQVDIYGHEYGKNWLSYNEPFMKWRKEFFLELFNEFGVPMEMRRLANNLEKTLRFSSQNSKLSGFLKEGDTLPGLPDFHVFETPGHAQSHLVFYREKDGLLLAGDHILKTVSSNPLIEPPMEQGGERAKSLLQYKHSLKKMMELDLGHVMTGHGNDIASLHPLLERRFERQRERAELVLSMLRNQPMTVFEVCVQLFPEVYKKETGLTLSETVGQFDYLFEQGSIHVDRVENGAIYYYGS
ncbi:MBL fold metallo-hydrolase [Domibacillus iocasae]|uniref:MBL fold metallo-hydrolase n=1 Tax=Domibacillus iocasae TaxID=1714016 RepID=A0A1E7DMY4_9BACI|nr:MBL fold metallo-hydrolase [Domibacillus iocasae]OES44432.1 MBL fold metallo-hydrolase [Domibacillus iocasae]